MKVLHSICQQVWKTEQWPQDWKRSDFISTPKKGNAKKCSNYHTIALISYASIVMLTILQAMWTLYEFNSRWTENFQMFKLDLEKAEEWEIKLPISVGSLKIKGVWEKHLLLLHWLYQRLWLCGSEQTVGNSSRDRNTRLPYLAPEKPVSRSRSNS